MKLSKEFIRVYDTIFAYIFKKEGLDGLIAFWKCIAPAVLYDLQEMAEKRGLLGCWEYWHKVLREEDAKFRLGISKDKKTLSLEITECPAIRALNIPSCPEYCRHCAIMYAEVLEPLGLKYTWNKKGNQRCEIKVEETK